jgi:hypothetical protein
MSNDELSSLAAGMFWLTLLLTIASFFWKPLSIVVLTVTGIALGVIMTYCLFVLTKLMFKLLLELVDRI